jgi:hypothetical protein
MGWNGSIFLDRECLRRVTHTTLYGYAYHLLHFIRWWESVHHTDTILESALTESTLLEYPAIPIQRRGAPATLQI